MATSWRSNPKVKAAMAEQVGRHAAQVVNLTLPLAPSVNSLYYNRSKKQLATAKALGKSLRGRGRTVRYQTWLRAAGNEINRQKPGRIAGWYDLTIEIAETAKLDLGNVEKALSDLLVRHGIVDDDAKAADIRLTRSAALSAREMNVVLRPRAVRVSRAA